MVQFNVGVSAGVTHLQLQRIVFFDLQPRVNEVNVSFPSFESFLTNVRLRGV